MVGNSSVSTLTLCVLALHTTLLAPHTIVAEEASTAVDEHYWIKARSKRTRHLRRHLGSNSRHAGSREERPKELEPNIIKQHQYDDDDGLNNESNNPQRKLSLCEWTPDMANKDGCTNNPNNILDEWLDIKEAMIHPTSQSCCDKFFSGKECNLYPDSSCESSSAGGSLSPDSDSGSDSGSSCEWTPEREHQDGCTNNPNNILDEWLHIDIKEAMIHPTSQSCCDKFFSGKECNLYTDSSCESSSAGGSLSSDSGSDSGGSSSCTSLGWHADLSMANACTDDDNYMPSWLNMKDFMFHATAETCCSEHYPVGGCKINPSGCSSDTKECISPGWHADARKDGCTNGVNYPKEWLEPTNINNVFFPTHEVCCTAFSLGSNCRKYDEGCTINPGMFGAGGSNNNCESEWHPDGKTKVGCTNDKTDYPPAWKSTPQSKAEYFFTNAQDCCQQYTPAGSSCPLRDLCNDVTTSIDITARPTAKPTSAPRACKWHSTSTATEIPWCTFSDMYPEEWAFDTDLSSQYLFETHDECCDKAHGASTCGETIVCFTPPPTATPTTGKPTPAPVIATARPTSSPISIFYVQYLSGMCVSASEVPKPYYVKESFTNYDDCCEKSHSKESCIKKGPTPSPTIYVPTISPAPTTTSPTQRTVYYVDHITGLCMSGYSTTIPFYITDIYTGYFVCCTYARDTAKCVKDGPTNVPTSQPSAVDTALPSSQPSNILSSQPSSQPSAEKDPTTTPTTFYRGALVSFSSKPTHRPTTADCLISSWYADSDAAEQGCTNYVQTNTSAVLLFQSAEECCKHHFEALDCTVRDNCRVTNSFISAVWNLKQPEDECDNYWHPDIEQGRDGCSNSRKFPESWHKNKENVLFDTVQDCCKKLYFDRGNDCKIYNQCTTEPPTKRPTDHPTPPPSSRPTTTVWESKTPEITSCEYAKWHISMSSQEILACSNSLVYPDAWNDATQQGKFLFESHADCCERFSHGDTSACEKHDDCESELSTVTGAKMNDPGTPCVSARWHLSRDFSKCSNDPDYPLSWLEDANRYFSDDPTECCLKMFNYEDCDIEDICASDLTTTAATSAAATSSTTEMTTTTTILTSTTTLTTTYRNTPSPTPGPTPKLTTAMPPAPQQEDNDLNNVQNHCNGKPKRLCSRDPECQYDITSRTCWATYTFVTNSSPNEPTAEASPPVICRGMTKKECVKDPECTWTNREKSCSQLASTAGGVQENKSDIAGASIQSQNCEARRWHPKTITDRTCSNSRDYPSLWNNPSLTEQHLFISFEQCCEAFYDGQCNKEDVCNGFTSG